jgi:hypothetical protein
MKHTRVVRSLANVFGFDSRFFSAALSLLALAVLGLGGSACQGVGVGDPCIPEDEYRRGFGGYSKDEVNVESRSFQCETRVCLVNKFQGRVTCPYGQLAGNGGCKTPDLEEDIAVPVPAQLTERRPDRSVYCSCRCDAPPGSDRGNAPFCECPEGYSCENLIDDIGLGNKQLAGGYCVKNGTEAESQSFSDTVCRGSECGAANQLY